ncbi:MAG TPA: ZIP family metal transporter [Planococcus sp. (in: firmicutes)]|nr:ZIP family metal transporter [Planococcus sp. (in: firmicutes)]
MEQALFWGAIAGSANLLGALLVLWLPLNQRIIAGIMALGTGTLIGAVVYGLLGEALAIGTILDIALGFLGGAAMFAAIDIIISRKGGLHRKRSGHGADAPNAAATGSGLAIFIGTVMDAIPETAMIGLSLVEDGKVSAVLIAAIFISNLPEGISSASGLKKGGYSIPSILLMWLAVLIISSFSSLAGYTLLAQASVDAQTILASFAAGAIIAMVSATMMPEAYEKAGPIVGFLTACGFFIALILH